MSHLARRLAELEKQLADGTADPNVIQIVVHLPTTEPDPNWKIFGMQNGMRVYLHGAWSDDTPLDQTHRKG